MNVTTSPQPTTLDPTLQANLVKLATSTRDAIEDYAPVFNVINILSLLASSYMSIMIYKKRTISWTFPYNLDSILFGWLVFLHLGYFITFILPNDTVDFTKSVCVVLGMAGQAGSIGLYYIYIVLTIVVYKAVIHNVVLSEIKKSTKLYTIPPIILVTILTIVPATRSGYGPVSSTVCWLRDITSEELLFYTFIHAVLVSVITVLLGIPLVMSLWKTAASDTSTVRQLTLRSCAARHVLVSIFFGVLSVINAMVSVNYLLLAHWDNAPYSPYILNTTYSVQAGAYMCSHGVGTYISLVYFVNEHLGVFKKTFFIIATRLGNSDRDGLQEDSVFLEGPITPTTANKDNKKKYVDFPSRVDSKAVSGCSMGGNKDRIFGVYTNNLLRNAAQQLDERGNDTRPYGLFSETDDTSSSNITTSTFKDTVV